MRNKQDEQSQALRSLTIIIQNLHIMSRYLVTKAATATRVLLI